MERYISANKLINDIEDSRANNEHNNAIASQTHNAEHRHFIKMVLDQPSIKIVHCKDCKHGKSLDRTKPPFKYYKDSCVLCECEDVVGEEPMVYLPTHFCSCGEMK